jgi:hypothetical protein
MKNITGMIIIPKRVIKILEERRNLWKAERQSYIQRRANNSNNEVRNKKGSVVIRIETKK